jgi:membrane-bound lytic murein transglycosylase F
MRAERAPAIVALAAALGGGTAASAMADWAEIKARGTLGVVITWPEANYFARDGDAHGPGLERELLERFAALHGLQLRVLEVAGYNDLIPALLEGRADLIACNITVTQKRQQSIAFSDEILPTRQVVVTRRPHRAVRSLDELRQEHMVTIPGTSMAEAIAAAGVPAGSVDKVTGQNVKLSTLVGKRGVTATVEEVGVAILRLREDPDLEVGLFLGPPGSIAWGVRKTDPALLGALNDFLGNVRRTATWSRLVVKYFGESSLDILRRARGDTAAAQP